MDFTQIKDFMAHMSSEKGDLYVIESIIEMTKMLKEIDSRLKRIEEELFKEN